MSGFFNPSRESYITPKRCMDLLIVSSAFIVGINLFGNESEVSFPLGFLILLSLLQLLFCGKQLKRSVSAEKMLGFQVRKVIEQSLG